MCATRRKPAFPSGWLYSLNNGGIMQLSIVFYFSEIEYRCT
jgi:hypothetical protein